MVYGAATGDLEQIPVVKLFALRSVTGFNLTAWRHAAPDRARHEMNELTALFAAGQLRTAVHASFPLTAAATAHTHRSPHPHRPNPADPNRARRKQIGIRAATNPDAMNH